ncbi:MAG: branched-chain amino acid transporter substrate-binding protein, partial [Frankiales bacterium]|nr:branched-chain amino acid transporter substrate-binding protein [Frankiales bacterium]
STGSGSTVGAASGGTTGSTSGRTGTAPGGTAGSGTTGQPLVDSSSVHLFTPREDRIGITPTAITMCAHAALTYAAAFHTNPSDLNVFWTAVNTEKGGIFGRKVAMTYEDDGYDPQKAVTAAKTCVAKHPFLMLGGIGFDQIPTVRNYAESVHQLYIYNSATVKGSAGLKYSFTPLPTVEKLGEGFAKLAAQKYKGRKIGILERDSSNWKPGVDAFKVAAKQYGLKIVDEEKAAASAGNYTAQIAGLKNAGADVVWIWLNALETTEVIKQMRAQVYKPNVMVFPFNLTSQTLKSDAMDPVMDGIAMYPAFSKGDYSGTFASYADDMKEFEAQYARYDPGADISGVAGDLLFLNWVGQKALYRQMLACGKDCTRNRFVELMQSNAVKPISSACPVDFVHGDRHHGGNYVTVMQTYTSPSGAVNWRETKKCLAV